MAYKKTFGGRLTSLLIALALLLFESKRKQTRG